MYTVIVLNTKSIDECVSYAHIHTYHEIIVIYLETNTAHTHCGSIAIYLGINSVLQAKLERVQGIGSFGL